MTQNQQFSKLTQEHASYLRLQSQTRTTMCFPQQPLVGPCGRNDLMMVPGFLVPLTSIGTDENPPCKGGTIGSRCAYVWRYYRCAPCVHVNPMLHKKGKGGVYKPPSCSAVPRNWSSSVGRVANEKGTRGPNHLDVPPGASDEVFDLGFDGVRGRSMEVPLWSILFSYSIYNSLLFHHSKSLVRTWCRSLKSL